MTTHALAAIAEGHADLADVLFLIAAAMLTLVAVVEALGRNVVISTRVAVLVAAALIAWGWFVL